MGHVSDSALAGLSLGSTIVLTAVGLCVFLAYSTTSQVARLFGAGRKREGLQAGMNSLWLSLSIGLVLAVLLFVFAELLCSVFRRKGRNPSTGNYLHSNGFAWSSWDVISLCIEW